MKHAVVYAHPNPKSFTATMAAAYGDEAQARGGTTVIRDLYAMGFDPCLKLDEIPAQSGFAARPDVVAERGLIGDADVFAFFYPLWLNAPPAILKGYLDRVFGFGFAYRHGEGGIEPALSGRKLATFSSSGAPWEWVRKTGAWDAMHKLFDEHFAAVCGLVFVDHTHFGNIVPGIREDFVAACATSVRELVRKHF
jgi:NAD(P)H dehydrogenase (quinone)